QPRHLAHERNARMTATSDRPTSSTSQTAAPAAAAGSEQLTADPTGPIPVLPDDAARLDVEAVSTAPKGKWADVRDTARERAARPGAATDPEAGRGERLLADAARAPRGPQ